MAVIANIPPLSYPVTYVIPSFIFYQVCKESAVTDAHVKALHAKIPEVVSMHLEDIENVCRESKRLPPILKVKPPSTPGKSAVYSR